MSSPEASKIKIYTIGHSTRKLEEFIGLLKHNWVLLVVDIRSIPRSRYNPQFNLDSLPLSLKNAGLEYQHLEGLGGLRHPLNDSVNKGWENESFRGFADYMQTPEFEKNIKTLIDTALKQQTTIMCAEAVPWHCHRSLISDSLTVRSIQVEHIIDGDKRRSHTLTSFALISGTKITYPPRQTELKI